MVHGRFDAASEQQFETFHILVDFLINDELLFRTEFSENEVCHVHLSGLLGPNPQPIPNEAVAQVLYPGGLLLAIFYLDPGLDPGESGPPFGTSTAELDSLFSSRFTLEAEWKPDRTYPGREGRELFRILRRTV